MSKRMSLLCFILFTLGLSGCAMLSEEEIAERGKAGKLASVQFYVPSEQDNKISIIDIPSSEVVGEIRTGEKPANLVFSSTMRTAYVANNTSGTVGIIDTQNLKMTKEIEVGPLPHGLALSSDNKKLYVTTVGDQFVSLIDTAEEKVIKQIDLGEGAKTNYPYLLNNKLFVSDHENNKVYIVVDDRLTKTIDTANTPRVIKTNEDGSILYVAAGGSQVVETYDANTGEKLNQIEVGQGATDFVINQDASLMVVTNLEGNSVSIVDLKSNQVMKEITGLKGPKHIAFNRKETMAYITLSGSDEVAVLDLDKKEIVNTIQVGAVPHGIQIKAMPGMGGSC